MARRRGQETAGVFLGLRETLRREVGWLESMPYASVRYALKHQGDAWRACFGGPACAPRFHAEAPGDSVTLPSGTVRLEGAVLHVPKIGPVCLRRALGLWCATVCYEVEGQARADDGLALGVDLNAGQVATITGEPLMAPDLSRLEAPRTRQHANTPTPTRRRTFWPRRQGPRDEERR